MTNKSPAHRALLDYRQADEDGVMVIVSRQAIHEVSDEIECLESMRIAERQSRFRSDECLRQKDVAMQELFRRLDKAGVSYSDLIS